MMTQSLGYAEAFAEAIAAMNSFCGVMSWGHNHKCKAICSIS